MADMKYLEDLRKAIENLHTFSMQMEQSPHSFLRNLEVVGGKLLPVDSSPLRKAMDIARRVMVLVKNKDDRSEVLDQILKSGNVVKSCAMLIIQLEHGDAGEQHLAADIRSVVNRFNAAIDKAIQPGADWESRFARFFHSRGSLLVGERLAKIELPSSLAIDIPFPIQSKGKSVYQRKLVFQPTLQCTGATIDKISALCQAAMPPHQPPTQTLELYVMKVISMLEQSALLSHLEARQLVKKTPCQVTADKSKQSVTISQRLELLPGQVICVSGVFLRDPRTSQYNIFEANSCRISLEAHISGFPHPLQRHGWALSDALIPFCIHRTDSLVHFPKLESAKKKAAHHLLPGGRFAVKAKELLEKKKAAFENYSDIFLTKHQNLATVLAAMGGASEDKILECINPYYEMLAHQSSSYELLAETHSTILHCCVIPLQETLQQLQRTGAGNDGVNIKRELETISREAIDHLAALDYEPRIKEYCCLMAESLIKHLYPIIEQYYSEILGYVSSPLSFESIKIQAAVYLQLEDFMNELTMNDSNLSIAAQMLKQLDEEIALFKADSIQNLPKKPYEIVCELNQYYQTVAPSSLK